MHFPMEFEPVRGIKSPNFPPPAGVRFDLTATLFAQKDLMARTSQGDPPTPGGAWVNRKGRPLRALLLTLSPYACDA